MIYVFDNPALDGQFMRTLGKAYYGSADVGECYAIAGRIDPTKLGTWQDEWESAAEALAASAHASAQAGHHVSAGEAYLRAAEYMRQSYFFDRLDLTGTRMLAAWRRQREYFREALRLLDVRHEIVSIPYAGTHLSGYLVLPSSGTGPWPTIISPAGYDSPIEEYWMFACGPALRRGYAVLMFDGPGQGSSLLEKGLFFRPDYEIVATAVVDFAVRQPDIDASRLVSYGRSFGGYLAPRMASGEHRPAACVADPGLFDVGAMMVGQLPPDQSAGILSGDTAVIDGFNSAILADPGMTQFFMSRAVTHGAQTPAAYVVALQGFAVPAAQITCPTLVTHQDGDGQSQALFDALTCPKELVTFTDAEGAGGHCEGAGQALFGQRVFDWLDTTLRADGPH